MSDDIKQLSIEQYTEFIKAHHISLRAYIYSLGVQPDWVDDMAQEVFVMAYRRLHTYDMNRDFGNWLRGIARNIVAYEIRRDARRQRLFNQAVTQNLLQLESTVMPAYPEEKQIPDIMMNCIDKLPPQRKKLLLQRYKERKSSISLAQELNISANALSHRLMRIRETVKRCIEKQLMGATA